VTALIRIGLRANSTAIDLVMCTSSALLAQ
jgi:hypothetical protein